MKALSANPATPIVGSAPTAPVKAIPQSLRDQIQAFKAKLNDFTRFNPLLFFKELKAGTLWLPETSTPVIAKLIDGSAVTLGDLGLAGDVKTRAQLRDIHLKAQANAEERGLQTLFVALGFVTWKLTETDSTAQMPAKGPEDKIKVLLPARDPFAPLVLLPVEIQDASRPGADPKIVRAGDLQINEALVAFVGETYKIRVAEDRHAEEVEDDLNTLLGHLREQLATLPGVTFPDRCVLGNFNFQKMAMVRDLTDHLDLISENDLIAAISGDATAQAKLSYAQSKDTGLADLDQIPAVDELFILDADSSQQQVLHSILHSETHAVIQGPPGTGKSQTIANLIAALIGAGKRVLFVAEKRAALDAVQKRLSRVGLEHLILDLHGADVKRKKIYEGLEASDRVARSTPLPDLANTYAQFEDARRELNQHDRAMHEERPGCKQSLYGLLDRLAGLPAATKSDIRFSLGQLQQLPASEMQKGRELFSDAATIEPFVSLAANVPWARAELVDDAGAEAAITLVSGLLEALNDVLAAIEPLAKALLRPACETISDLASFANAVETVSGARDVFEPALFDLNLDEIVAALKPHEASLGTRALAFFNADARAQAKKLRAVARSERSGHDLFVVLESLMTLPVDWRSANVFAVLDRNDPRSIVAGAETVARQSVDFLALAKPSEPIESLSALQSLLTTYQRTQTNAYKVVQAHTVIEKIAAHGFVGVLKELQRVPRPPVLWPDVFEGTWLRSFVDKISVEDPAIAGFNRERFELVIAKFQRLDLERLSLAARRIRRTAAELYFKALEDRPDQAIVFRTNLARKTKQLPLRKLMEQAGQVTTALCPCWMASPLSVSQLTDPRSKFDVVIFDEASQVLPEDAITSIIRGTRVVIAGDKHQLPPTAFFAAADESDDDESAGGDADDIADKSRNIESILDLMSIYVQPRSLTWHYRSLDERLIAFSNKEFYGNALITFPSREEPPPAMQHFLVDDAKRDGEEQSSSAEVLRVVDLVLDHAAKRPGESLGVIAMGIKHATRIERTLYETRQKRQELDSFFSEQGERSFFCKNLERVQGDERDAIILSVGYGKNLKGDMVYRFGPLNNAGGERRLNVAVSRAVRRMALVSSFRSSDMDDKKLSATGAKVLKRYIRFSESDGRDLGDDEAKDKVPMNDFEADIYHALTARGLSLVPQWGTSSYRLDFAVQDPRAPGSFCLAIECDGATYHSAQTARDRDRIRQTHLEAQGWKFHRIWSTDWFGDRQGEIERTVEAYEGALLNKPGAEPTPQPIAADASKASSTPMPAETKRAIDRPKITAGAPIDSYSPAEILAVVRWIASDGLLRTQDEMIRQTSHELGFSRLGAKIERTLRPIVVSSDSPQTAAK